MDVFFLFNQKTAYEMRISDWSSDVCSSDLFDHKVRLDIILRVSSLNTVQPAALKELNQILEKQFSGNSNASRTTLGGIKRAADIMNFLDSSIEGQLMDSIREFDEDLSGQIDDHLFVKIGRASGMERVRT